MKMSLYYGIFFVSLVGIYLIFGKQVLYAESYILSANEDTITLENSYQPGQYFTISMYDDSLIIAGSEEEKVAKGNSDSMKTTAIKVFDGFLADVRYFTSGKQSTPHMTSGDHNAYYQSSFTGDVVEITRRVKHNSKTIIGMHRSIIVPLDSKILINDSSELRVFPANENRRFVTDGITSIVISVDNNPYAVEIEVSKAEQVLFSTIDSGVVITATSFFSEFDQDIFGWFTDIQQLRIVPNNYD
ncbi:hypothetical protein COY32_02020 [candidate division WWE3 bacterium CG_4_10_14_0_2_um_filter_41_14]|uniref:Uncharacterized protein n=1 Tax=candidate division WWE3 bacterium CG_4_10_14_0_2_um_filter_41_14 TaxID=1975072 RepID=A0A2M7TKD2_UNCKA|nr:MAG: hypothetical protein COY32_02020 [candidate division WWE3 bacterium CG_4_10_14_0_2_um_filter_41_14]